MDYDHTVKQTGIVNKVPLNVVLDYACRRCKEVKAIFELPLQNTFQTLREVHLDGNIAQRSCIARNSGS